MGLGAHKLSPKGLRKFNRKMGVKFDVVYKRTEYGVAIIQNKFTHLHFNFDTKTGRLWLDENPMHFTSCREPEK